MSKKQVKINLIFLLVLATLLAAFYVDNSSTYANTELKPDLTLYIHGEKSEGGPIFHSSGNIGNGFWQPGASNSGTIRIYNNYSDRIKVTNLGLSMRLEQLQTQDYKMVTDKELYELFAKNMKLTIKKGTMLIFSSTVYDKSFFEMLYDKEDEVYNGYDLSNDDIFNIKKDEYIDLEYTVSMSEEAGNELQGLKATADFIINSHENPTSEIPDKLDKPKEDEPVDTDDHWAHDCIQTLIEHGIIQGYPDGTIRPENYITRAETAVLVSKALGIEESEGFVGYIDFIPAWAKGYIKAGSEKGFLEGYPSKTFKPDKNITRQEFTAVLIRAFEKEIDEDVLLEFVDSSEISKWAVDYIKAGTYHNIINGYPDSTFKPKNNITRAEAFTIICKLLGYHDEHGEYTN